MIIAKVLNHELVQVALAGQSSHQLLGTFLATRNKKQIASLCRTLVQSTSQHQKVTNTNNQQLIPIARNISFRQCDQTSRPGGRSKVSFSISASSPGFISADLEHPPHERESHLDALRRKARDVKERRELASRSKYYGQSFNETLASSSERRLVVIMSWLEAKEKHIEKYRQFYLDRGFDVLNVKTSPLDLLLPNSGAKKISEDFVRFMTDKQYSNVVLHGFSVGGYMFGRLLLEIDQLDEQRKSKLLSSIRGLVFDSLVPFEGLCVGVANSITMNPIAAKLLENLLKLYLYLGHNIATKHYLEASDKVWAGPLKCPTLFLNSREDKISDYNIIERLASGWQDAGIDCHKMVVEKSPHVQLFTKHHEAYVSSVEKFLKHIKMA